MAGIGNILGTVRARVCSETGVTARLASDLGARSRLVSCGLPMMRYSAGFLFAGAGLALATSAAELPAQSMGAQSRGVIGIRVSVMPQFKVVDPAVLTAAESDRGRAGPRVSALLSNTPALRYTVEILPPDPASEHPGEAVDGPAHCAPSCALARSGPSSGPRLVLVVPD